MLYSLSGVSQSSSSISLSVVEDFLDGADSLDDEEDVECSERRGCSAVSCSGDVVLSADGDDVVAT